MVVSITSMKVGMTTATATIQGLIAGRLMAGGESATVAMARNPNAKPRMNTDSIQCFIRVASVAHGFPVFRYGFGSVDPLRSDANGCSTAPAFGPSGVSR